ncbi:MAG: stage V sporulation protein AC [Clostridia bacterium]|nr:stage V sporulation protein AC [Clostridia bacterium]
MARASQAQAEAYRRQQQKAKPPVPWARNLFWAFLVGGTICTVGEVVLKFFMAQGMRADQAAVPTASVMVLIGSLLTGLGVYDELVRLAGMGAALPITGFANSIVAPAMEYKREGWVMGVGARMFQVAGPVIVYGIVVSFAVGLVWFLVHGGPR